MFGPPNCHFVFAQHEIQINKCNCLFDTNMCNPNNQMPPVTDQQLEENATRISFQNQILIEPCPILKPSQSTRSSEARIMRYQLFPVYFSRGTLPQKRGEKGHLAGGLRKRTPPNQTAHTSCAPPPAEKNNPAVRPASPVRASEARSSGGSCGSLAAKSGRAVGSPAARSRALRAALSSARSKWLRHLLRCKKSLTFSGLIENPLGGRKLKS